MQALLTAECCTNHVAADESATDATRDLAYSAGLCHNPGLMVLAHMLPDRTTAILQAHREQAASDNLGRLLFAEFETDHKIMTSELVRVWSLPEPMIAAYDYRAFPGSHSADRLCLIVAAGAAAIGNTEMDQGRYTNLKPWADAFGLMAEDLQKMAVLGDRQKARVRSTLTSRARVISLGSIAQFVAICVNLHTMLYRMLASIETRNSTFPKHGFLHFEQEMPTRH